MSRIISHLEKLEPVRHEFSRYRNYFTTRWKTFEYALEMLERNGLGPRFDKALEIGCGTGYYLSLLAQLADEVTGIDLARGSAATCEAGFANAKRLLEITGTSNAVLKDGVMERIPLEDDSVDLVFSAYVLEHVLDLHTGLAECNRVLRADGIMVSVVPGALDKLAYLFSLDYLKHTAFSALRPILHLSGIKRTPELPWRIPLAPWPHDLRKTFFQELREYRLGSWLSIFQGSSHQVVDVGRCRLRDHIIITRKCPR